MNADEIRETLAAASARAADKPDILARLDRAHLMGCSDPTDPTRRTTSGDAAKEIRDLRAALAEASALHVEPYPEAGWCAGCHDGGRTDEHPCATLRALHIPAAQTPSGGAR